MKESCPHAGAGVHRWLLSEANRCRLRKFTPTATESALRDGSSQCGRRVSSREIGDAVAKAFNSSYTAGGYADGNRAAKTPKWPERKERAIARIANSGLGIADLWEASRIRGEDDEQHTEEIIDRLFPGNPLLCCGKFSWEFDTKPREEWRGQLDSLQLIVPSPMTAVSGPTTEGKQSRHALSITGPRRFMITEFDDGSLDHHAALILHLSQYGPLVCALHSGGKSMHAWFYTAGHSEDRVRRFFRYAVSLGADPACDCRSQFVRMPDGIRSNGTRQTVYFLDFSSFEL